MPAAPTAAQSYPSSILAVPQGGGDQVLGCPGGGEGRDRVLGLVDTAYGISLYQLLPMCCMLQS